VLVQSFHGSWWEQSLAKVYCLGIETGQKWADVSDFQSVHPEHQMELDLVVHLVHLVHGFHLEQSSSTKVWLDRMSAIESDFQSLQLECEMGLEWAEELGCSVFGL